MDERAPLLSSWFTAAFTVVFAASVAAVLFASGIGRGVGFGPLLAAALSFAAYGGLALGGFRRAPLEDRVSWWVAVMVAHAAFGLLAAWLFGLIGALGLEAALGQAFGGFGPAALVSLIAAPLAALPFRPSVPVWRVPRATDSWIPPRDPEPRPGAAPVSVDQPARWMVPARPAVTPASRPSDLPPAPDVSALAHGPVVRITFERIADQLPPDMLALPPARLAATLLAPGEMRVPVGLVLPRLHEGAVAVPATVLEDQLPRGAVLATSPEARARWNALRLALPMDEVMAQLPADASRAGTVPAGAVATIPTVTWAAAGGATRDPESSVQAVAGAAGDPESSVQAVAGAAGDPESSVRAVAGAVRDEPTDPLAAGAPTPWRRLRPDEIAVVADHLAPAGRFETHSRDVDRLGHLVVCVRHLGPEAVESAVRRLVDVLPSPSGAPVVLTLVTDRAAVALAVGAGVAIAAGARHPAAPVALMELLVARAATAIGADPGWAPEDFGGRLRPASAPPALDPAVLGETRLDLGGAEPSVLRHDDGRVDVYVFPPSDVEPAALGGLAAALDRALEGLDLGRAVAVSLRETRHRTEVRWVEGRAAVVAASGIVSRPGLSRRLVARAAAALEASVGVNRRGSGGASCSTA